jgi:hypothetical protein
MTDSTTLERPKANETALLDITVPRDITCTATEPAGLGTVTQRNNVLEITAAAENPDPNRQLICS